jgi:integrase
VAVYDRWHRDPQDGDKPCEHSRGRHKAYPSAVHGQGKRWQVQWEDPNAPGRKRLKRNFDLRDPGPGELPDRNKHASAYDKEIQGSIVRQDYTDPNAGNVTLREYAETWRETRVHGESAAKNLEVRLRLHVYEGAPRSARTPKGGVAIGQHAMGFLEQRPSLVAAWVAAMPLSDGSKRLVISDVSAIFQAAAGDGIVRSDPTRSKSVDKPGASGAKAQPYAPADVAGIAAKMPERFRVVPELGAGTGMREMEMAGLGADDIVRGKAPKIRVLRQVKVAGGELRFGPVKNKKPHDVPVPPELLELLDAHMREFPPVTVSLPWHEPGSKLHGEMVTVHLVLSQQGAAAAKGVMNGTWRTGVNRWLAARSRFGGPRKRSMRGYGIHRLRHTFASVQLRDGVDVVRVAAWMGDTVAVVTKTYLHLMPDDHDGEQAGRSASAAFLKACAPAVPPEGRNGTPGQLEAV